MTKKIQCIEDPEKVEKHKTEILKQFKMRALETQESIRQSNGTVVVNKVKPPDDAIDLGKRETVKGFDKLIECQNIFDRVMEGIEEKIPRKIYFVGKDNKLFCGPVLQVIPISTCAFITSGQSTYSPKPPFDGQEFKFEKTRQIMFKVGRRVGKDFVIVVAQNGCVFMESESYGVLNMPVYVVEPTAQYYYLNHGNRSLFLGAGSHLIVYTKEAPIIFATFERSTHHHRVVPAQVSQPIKPTVVEKKEEKPEEKDKSEYEETKSNISKDSDTEDQPIGDTKAVETVETLEKKVEPKVTPIEEPKADNSDNEETKSNTSKDSDKDEIPEDSEKHFRLQPIAVEKKEKPKEEPKFDEIVEKEEPKQMPEPVPEVHEEHEPHLDHGLGTFCSLFWIIIVVVMFVVVVAYLSS